MFKKKKKERKMAFLNMDKMCYKNEAYLYFTR